MAKSRTLNIKAPCCKKASQLKHNESKKLVKKNRARDRDSDVKKGRIAELRGKNKREGEI